MGAPAMPDTNAASIFTESGFGDFRFSPGFPGVDLCDVDSSIELFGRQLAAPILLAPPAGATPAERQLGSVLAEVAQELGPSVGISADEVAPDRIAVEGGFASVPLARIAEAAARISQVHTRRSVSGLSLSGDMVTGVQLTDGSEAPFDGVVLAIAGAWTDTGWPATMESAVRSGRAAVQWLDGQDERHAA